MPDFEGRKLSFVDLYESKFNIHKTSNQAFEAFDASWMFETKDVGVKDLST